MKIHIMQSSPVSGHFLPPRLTSSPQHPVLKHPRSMTSLTVTYQVSHTHKTDKIMVFNILVSKLLQRIRQER